MSQLNRDYKDITDEYEREQPKGQDAAKNLLYTCFVFFAVLAFTYWAITKF